MSNGLIVDNKNIVIPGETLAKGMDYLPGENTYREGELIYAKALGLVSISGRVIKINPVSGPYLPKAGDKIIGQIKDITFSGWRINTNTAYSAMLNVKDATSRFIKRGEDLSKILGVGEFVIAKITNVTSQNLIDLSMKDPELYKIEGGRIIKINALKVPRVIGKQGSMVSLIKRYTGCDITVGQNGLIFVKGKTPEQEHLAGMAIKKVEQEAHKSGLTERVEQFLKEDPNSQVSNKDSNNGPTNSAPVEGGEE